VSRLSISHPLRLLSPAVTALVLLPLACSEEPAADDGVAGTSAAGAQAGSGSGTGGLGGTAGTLGGGAGAGTAGTSSGSSGGGGMAASGGAGAGGGGAGSGGSGGTPGGEAGSLGSGTGGSQAGGSSGAAGGSAAGDGGVAGTMSTGGAATGGSAGTAGAPGDDRCDIANYDAANPPEVLTLSGNLGTHDPVVIAAHDQFYMFHTGNGVGAKTSSNFTSWQGAPAVFNSNPSWIAESVPGVSNLWAPDISYFGGQYHLYYSASTFGDNRSCIGHATRAALNSGSWTDHGAVVCSNVDGNDNWNAIDPNVIVDVGGTPWLSFGSFWGGLKLVELTQEGARANDTLTSIAARPQNNGALEAPFIIRRCGYYYLFVSFDTCCQGVNSTYKTMVGRSTEVTGPYTDKEGTAMMQGGGTLILEGGTRYKGPGHNAVIFTEDAAYNVYHSYDANANGQSVLRISELVFDAEGWPISGGP
jgi:arabinan endo-1,5-alpha-L-arabinosidase